MVQLNHLSVILLRFTTDLLSSTFTVNKACLCLMWVECHGTNDGDEEGEDVGLMVGDAGMKVDSSR